MNDWRQYFSTKLTASGLYTLDSESIESQITLMIFTTTDKSKDTKIKVGVMDIGDLITLQFIDSRTPGFSKQQEQEYFYKFDFYSDKANDGPGIEFNQNNIKHFDNFLAEGLKGREVQYFKNGRIVQADIFQYYGTNDDNSYGTTISLEELTWIENLKILLKRKERFYDSKKEIQLRDIFSGV